LVPNPGGGRRRRRRRKVYSGDSALVRIRRYLRV
jgi:hypothetical protein